MHVHYINYSLPKAEESYLFFGGTGDLFHQWDHLSAQDMALLSMTQKFF